MTNFDKEKFDRGMSFALNSKFWAAANGLSIWRSGAQVASRLEHGESAHQQHESYKQGAAIMRKEIGDDAVTWCHENPMKILVVFVGCETAIEAKFDGFRIRYRFCKA